ncbi:MAG: hypothetical protein UH625_06935 [Muribaculaceae bacterium]|nr:hypothetical protein [Muribaculaceae bacterium]
MISKKSIDYIYKKHCNRPESPDCLDIILLFEGAHPSHGIEIDGDNLIISSVPEWSPFRSIPLNNIHAIVDFEETVAVVLPRSIIFLSKVNNKINVHIKDEKTSFMERMRNILCKNAAL